MNDFTQPPTVLEFSRLIRLHDVAAQSLRDRNLTKLLDELLDTILMVTRGDGGILHVRDADTGQLRAAAVRGFSRETAAPLATANESDWPFGAAIRLRERVVVDHVSVSDGFATSVKRALTQAGMSSVQATPIVTRAGERLGVVSSFFRSPYRRRGPRLQMVDVYVRHGADLIEHCRAQQSLHGLWEEERNARRRAEERSRQKDEFLVTLAHELRQPLSSAMAAHEVARQSTSEDQRAHAHELVERQLRHLGRLVEDLDDLSNVGRGAIDLRRERVDLRSLVQQSLDMVAPLLEERGHVTTVALGHEPVCVLADSTRLIQVFVNLLKNSAMYTEPGGHIVVAIEADRRRVIVRLRDNGIGIAAEDLERVFGRYERLMEQRGVGGAGIGLSVVRRLVEMHGGTVTATSAGPGAGSEFVVDLTALRGAAETEADLAASRQAPAAAS